MAEQFDQWAIVEIMGHQKYAGLVTSEVIGGASFVRVDVPACDGKQAFTKLFGAGSIYCITVVSKEVAVAMAAGMRREPVNVYDLPESMRKPQQVPRLETITQDEDYYEYEDE